MGDVRVKIILHLRIKFEKNHEDQLLFSTKFKMHGPNGNFSITNVHFGNHLKAGNNPDDDGDRQTFGNNPGNEIEDRCIWRIHEGPNGRYHVSNNGHGGQMMLSNAEDDDGDRCLYTSERDCGNRFEWEISPVAGQYQVFTIRNPHTNNYLKLSWNEDCDADRTVHGNGADKGVEESCPERFWWRLDEQ